MQLPPLIPFHIGPVPILLFPGKRVKIINVDLTQMEINSIINMIGGSAKSHLHVLQLWFSLKILDQNSEVPRFLPESCVVNFCQLKQISH